jgi:hypothetical protein
VKLAVTAEGSLSGRIVRLSIEDARASLAYEVRIPVRFRGEQASVRVELRHPEVRGWRGLIGRDYRFDESTRRWRISDGERYAVDDVYADVRAPNDAYDTFVTRVEFGKASEDRLDIAIEGKVHVAGQRKPFRVEGRVQIGGVVTKPEFRERAISLLAKRDYCPPKIRKGLVVFDPRF